MVELVLVYRVQQIIVAYVIGVGPKVFWNSAVVAAWEWQSWTKELDFRLIGISVSSWEASSSQTERWN
jgi:hypothetical protein